MATISVTIPSVTEYSVTPTRTSPSTFFADREARLSEEATRIPEQNAQAEALNTFKTQANAVKDEANTAASIVSSNTILAQSASASAVAAKVAIDGYVIPTTATDNLAELKTKRSAQFVASGTINKQDDSNVFSATIGNEYKMAKTDRFVNLDGNVFDTYGPELVTNGDFSDGTTGWATIGATIANGVCSFVDSSGNLTQHSILTLGTAYVVEFNISNYKSGGVARVYNGSYFVGDTINSNGKYKFAFTTNQTTFQMSAETPSCDFDIDNISVKEITTVDMTNYIPEVQVQDQATNGLVVQSSVNAGDYVVVDKEELVTNGTFDTDVVGWSILSGTPTFSSTGGQLLLTATGDDIIQTTLACNANTDYVLKYDFIKGTGSYEYIFVIDSSGTTLYDSENGIGADVSRTINFTTDTDTTVYIRIKTNVGTSYWDNISVQLKNDIYRAKVTAPALTELTNTTYYETRSYISNQVLAYRQSDGTLGYETLFVDATETDTANDVMTKNSWSKLSNGYYSKGLISATPMYLVQT